MPTLVTSSKSKGGKKLSSGPAVIRWIESHCRLTNAKWYGKPFKLLPWQRLLLLGLFEVDAETRRRLIRWAYISVPKKNGKTELLAALALWFLVASGEPVPLIAVAAGSDDQADELFGAIKRMVEASPTLSKVCTIYEKEITCPSIPGGKIVRVAATAKSGGGSNLDGKNIFVVICDELHVWEGDRGKIVWNTLTNGTVVREEPMVVQITTAGYDRESICYQQYTYAKRVISGEVDDPAYYAWISEAADGSAWDDPNEWESTNPSFGDIMQEPFYRDQLTKKPENIFRRFFMNQWTRSDESWLPPGAWDAGRSELEIPDGAEITVGIDVSLYHDHTAVAWCHRTENDQFIIRCRTWAPPADGSGIDAADIVTFIRDLSLRYRIVNAEYDPRFFDVPGRTLFDEGIPIFSIPQSAERMVPACGFAYEQIVAGNVLHDGDETLSTHVLAAAQRASERGWTLSKGKSKHVIDACIAMVIALHGQTRPAEPVMAMPGAVLL